MAKEFAIESYANEFEIVSDFIRSLLTLLKDSPHKILYCRCAFAQVVPEETKNSVLEGLCESEADFECVSDLCEMAARKDPRLTELLEGDLPVRVAACYPRAVRWLFHQAGVSVPDESSGQFKVCNMRDSSASEILDELQSHED